MSRDKLLDIVKKIPMNIDPTKITEFQRILIEAWREVKIVEEQERTKREAIQALKEVTMKKLEILDKSIDKVLTDRLEVYKASVYKSLELIDEALASGDNEKLKLAVTTLIHALDQDLFEGIDKLGRALRGEEVDEIEI